MWVLIVFYFSSGNPAIAMHDFGNQAACEKAAAAVKAIEPQLKGIPQVTAVCTPKML